MIEYILSNLHYYFLILVGFFIWSANYITSPKHIGLLNGNFDSKFKFVNGLIIILLFLGIFFTIIFIFFSKWYLLLVIFFIFFFLLYLMLLTFLKNWYNPKTYHDIYFKGKKKPYIKIRLIDDKDNKYLIYNDGDFLFIKKDDISKIKFNYNN